MDPLDHPEDLAPRMATKRQLDYEAMAHAILLADNLKRMSYRDAMIAMGVVDPNSREVRILRRAWHRLYKSAGAVRPLAPWEYLT